MKKPHILDSAADWATWYREMAGELFLAVREVLDLNADGVIALPPDTLLRLTALAPDDSDTDDDE